MSQVSKIRKLSNAEFEELISTSKSRSEVFKKLKMRASGASYQILDKRIEEEGTDVIHFKVGGACADNRKFSNEEVFVEDSKLDQSSLRNRIIKDKLIEYKCRNCGLEDEWNQQPITLQLDHINGIRNDNRLLNLRYLCPNCHSQTKTFGAKKREAS